MNDPQRGRLPANHSTGPVRRLQWPAEDAADPAMLVRREWLVTNGLGGYASGTVVGAITRRYHGLLIAALPSPVGRVILLNHLSERIRFPDRSHTWLGVHGLEGRLTQVEGARHLVEFRLVAGIPTWQYRVRDATIERTVLMPHGQNTVHVNYRLVEGDEPLRITLRPLLGFRTHDASVDRAFDEPYDVRARGGRIEVRGDPAFPPLRMALHAEARAFTLDDHLLEDARYELEEDRGYPGRGPLWTPGYFRAELEPGGEATLMASAEPWDTIGTMTPEEARHVESARRTRLIEMATPVAHQGPAAELVLAADQFVVRPSRSGDDARARAGGREARTIIAGYHWFTDWGRDTMISLEGLTLLTGRDEEARDILQTFAGHVRDGLIPNLFPEGGREGLYHTADATLWFFHALDRYEHHTGDERVVDELLPVLLDIVRHHVEGTRFGIGMDADGLLRQGAEGYQLTWMDAKVDDWVVTPRRGKAVEINALWYNALRVLQRWLSRGGEDEQKETVGRLARRAAESFNARFWNPAARALFDVVDGENGDDDACRPNQVFAISLPHAVLDRTYWEPVLERVMKELYTPFGLRSLARQHPDYKPRYFGDLRARDAAYHQGTVWMWLLGPLVDAWLAVHPDDRRGARALVTPALEHLDTGCIGSLSEIFDSEPPFTPRGCIAQAWSVAECLRAIARTAGPGPGTASLTI